MRKVSLYIVSARVFDKYIKPTKCDMAIYEAIPARARDLSLRTPHSTCIENNLDEGLNDIDWINTHTKKNSFRLETAVDGWMSASVGWLAATTSGANDSSRVERERLRRRAVYTHGNIFVVVVVVDLVDNMVWYLRARRSGGFY